MRLMKNIIFFQWIADGMRYVGYMNQQQTQAVSMMFGQVGDT